MEALFNHGYYHKLIEEIFNIGQALSDQEKLVSLMLLMQQKPNVYLHQMIDPFVHIFCFKTRDTILNGIIQTYKADYFSKTMY